MSTNNDRFLSRYGGEAWEKSFRDAAVYDTKKEATKRLDSIKRGYKDSCYAAPFMWVRCVKIL